MLMNASGTLGYAGLSAETLLSRARGLFAQPPAPKRFDLFLPLFPAELTVNMEYIGGKDDRGRCVAASGFSIDPTEYHEKLYARLPELYMGNNYLRNFTYDGRYTGRGVVSVDRTWADRFPQYAPFLGDKLVVYLIGGGGQAVVVPESVYPRGGMLLASAENELGITERAQAYVRYVRVRATAGEPYDADAFSADYMEMSGYLPTELAQNELARVLQDLAMVKSLQNDSSAVGNYTENARRAERMNQYVPMRYACDDFTETDVDKHTSWLAQLYWQGNEYISDLWIPYQDFFACVDKQTMTLDVRVLCEACQIAPRYDAATGGGLYPDAVRVASVRDQTLKLNIGEARNNPAYGSGKKADGARRQVYIPESMEMLRQRKLVLEKAAVNTRNRLLDSGAYRDACKLATLQEHKGRLVDAMYRCEKTLRQIDPAVPAYRKAEKLLNARVEKLEKIVADETERFGNVKPSGYDEEIAYLQAMRGERLGEPTDETERFAQDDRLEKRIESGYAMRAGLLHVRYADAALPEAEVAPDVGDDDGDDDMEPAPNLTPETVLEALRQAAPAEKTRTDEPDATDASVADPQSEEILAPIARDWESKSETGETNASAPETDESENDVAVSTAEAKSSAEAEEPEDDAPETDVPENDVTVSTAEAKPIDEAEEPEDDAPETDESENDVTVSTAEAEPTDEEEEPEDDAPETGTTEADDGAAHAKPLDDDGKEEQGRDETAPQTANPAERRPLTLRELAGRMEPLADENEHARPGRSMFDLLHKSGGDG